MSSPIRILFICHDGEIYGSQQSLLLILKHLPADRFQCFVSIARPGPLNDCLAEIPSVTVLSHRRLQWIKHDPRTPLKRLGDIAGMLAGAVPKANQLVRYIKDYGIHLVHTNSTVSLEGALAARMAGVPHIWHIREMFMKENPKLQTVLGREWTRCVIHQFSDQVLCISEAVRRQFEPYLKTFPDKYRLLYNAMTGEAASSAEYTLQEIPTKKTGFRIGYIGRLSAGKRFQDLLEAFHQLRGAGDLDPNMPDVDMPDVDMPDVDMIVAGNFVDEAFQQKIERMIQDYRLQESVHMLGYRSDVAALYSTMDVMVVPSLNEPFGRVVIEGMRAGVPCIAANSGGIPEIVTNGETGLLYPPKDTVALAETLKTAMADRPLLSRIRENAGRMVRERFTIEEQIRTLEAIYRQWTPTP